MKTSMPAVTFCNVEECAYNDHENCRAAAITVDGPEPLCDTFCKNQEKGGIAQEVGSVGACKMERAYTMIILNARPTGSIFPCTTQNPNAIPSV